VFRIRLIMLSLFAMFAMSAAATASASAATTFLSSPTKQAISAEQKEKHIFTVEGKKVECTKATFTAVAPATEAFTELETSAAYSGCTAFGFISSEVLMNGCTYVLHAAGTVDIKCPAGKKIEVDVNNGSGCVISIGAQTGLKTIEYLGVTGKNGRLSVEIKIKAKEIAAESNGKGLGCPKSGAQKGEYTGTAVAEGATGTLDVE